jgi:hypothetical protein
MLSTHPTLRLASSATLAAIHLIARPALAAPTDEAIQAARELFSQAERDEDAEHWQDALDKLKRVSTVKLTAGVSYHLALCEEHLGQLATALTTYLAAQEEAARAGAQDVSRLVGPQLASLAPRVPHLTLQVEPSLQHPVVTLDGEVLASDQPEITVAINPGQHHVEASAPGHLSSSITVEIREGKVTVLQVTLAPAPAPPIPAAPSPPEVSRQPASHETPVAGIALAAAAGVLAGFGIVAFVEGGSSRGDAVRECAQMTSCPALKDTVQGWDWAALGSWSGAAVGATLAVLLLTRRPTETAGPSAAHLVIGPGSVGVAGSF